MPAGVAFDLSLDNVWYGKVILLFKMTVRTDDDEMKDVKGAMIDVYFNYADGRLNNESQVYILVKYMIKLCTHLN